ncbi:methylmalonyl-CoA mutase [Leptospira perolatii]|uniref:Methylmalonyl-CoA mutase n=1 Tax=Leptospira perolatii TaxID=2023191 RepID=A0A2M9ZPK4_9LEPT|nr:methylmalonyl-CoA mutase family protein [Leptospira perolatii]PJZ70652.1 methylmalonyl-CoA mutase [Leptospira perolatii]PJZ73863.1 methylmalonyl-CoA mutase [Leptospira perolatii]
MNFQKLFQEFPPVKTEEWLALIQKDLKGADFEKKLVWQTEEGFKVQPFYRKEDLNGKEDLTSNLPGVFPFTRSTRKLVNDWSIRQDIDSSDIETAKILASEAIANGVSSIGFVIQNKTSGRKGIPIQSKADLEKLLSDIPLAETTVHFVAEELSPEIYSWLPKSQNIVGGLGYDPIRILARHGRSGGHGIKSLSPILQETANKWPHFRALTVHSSTFSDAGATIVQELAFTLSLGAEYLFQLSEAGIDPAVSNSQTLFQFTIGPDYFLQIAKFRAARTLWSEIFRSYSSETGEKSLPFITAETSRFNFGIYDVYNNLLRGTTEAMSAAIGGCEIISVLPFDHLLHPGDSFSLRIARNIQLLMKHESYLDKVVDPASGSYYLESLTENLIEKAWDLFCDIEEEGGFTSSLKSGKIQSRIKDSRKQKEENYSTRKSILLGTNQYPNLKDRIEVSELNKSIRMKPLESVSGEEVCEAIPDFFAGDSLEHIRKKTEDWEKANSRKLKVLLLPLGDLKMQKARAIFVLNFLGCAGFEVIDPGSFASSENVIAQIKELKPDGIVFCSADEEYPNWVKEILPQTSKQSIRIALIAGYPKDKIEELNALGITGYIHAKSNLLETLSDLQKKLGFQ